MVTRLLYNILISKGKKISSHFEDITQDPVKYNLELLFRILDENKDTVYGRKYGFSDIRSLKDFKERVPFSNYDTYHEFIEKMRRGETGFITAQAPIYFAATSGSVANPKSIPVRPGTREIYKDYGSAYGFSVIHNRLKNRWKKGKILNLMEVRVKDTPCGTPYGAVSGMAVSSIKPLLPYLFTTPLECAFPTEIFDSNYVHLRFALEYRNLSGVVSAFMTAVADIFRYLRTNWRMLVDDIENGTINTDVNMSTELRASLSDKIKPNPKRAAELRREFEKGFGDAVIQRIWPDFAFVYAIGSGGFTAYTNAVREYIGDAKIYFSFFAASESMMAVCTEMESMKYTLLPESAFYEFIPFENSDQENPDTLTLDQIKEGEKYELVLTNPSGFYRYRIQDVVEVVGRHNNTPQIQFAFRLNQTVNMAGEKTNDGHSKWAVQECAKAFGCSFLEYSICPKDSELPGYYAVVLESDKPEEIVPRLSEISELLGQKLNEANPSLGAKIESGMLGSTRVYLVQQETYALYRDLMVMRGISANQIKPIRIIDTPEKERFFFGLLYREEGE